MVAREGGVGMDQGAVAQSLEVGRGTFLEIATELSDAFLDFAIATVGESQIKSESKAL